MCTLALASLVQVAPGGVIATIAGLALLGTLASALEGSMTPHKGREAAVVTFLVAASGITAYGVSSAAWAILAGLIVHAVLTGLPKGDR